MNANGSIDYDPNGAFVTTATDTFSYTVSDGNGGTDTATVTLTLLPNTPPVANPNDYTVTPTDQDTVFGAGRNVITDAPADVDPDGDDANLTVVGNTEQRAGRDGVGQRGRHVQRTTPVSRWTSWRLARR